MESDYRNQEFEETIRKSTFSTFVHKNDSEFEGFPHYNTLKIKLNKIIKSNS